MEIFINNGMNYLTNYYKNLCEQLQERLNILEKQINEAYIRSPMQQSDAAAHRDKLNRTYDEKDTNVMRLGLLPRRDQMVHFQAALEISEPHEKEAIEAVLTDMANSKGFIGSRGTAANMQSMRTAIGAVKRLKGTEQFEKSLSALQKPIKEKGAEHLDRERFYRWPTSISDDSHNARVADVMGAEDVVLGSRRPKREPNNSPDSYEAIKARDEQKRMEWLKKEERLKKEIEAKGIRK